MESADVEVIMLISDHLQPLRSIHFYDYYGEWRAYKMYLCVKILATRNR